MAKPFAEILRSREVRGNLASDYHEPVKRDMREWGTAAEEMIQEALLAATSGRTTVDLTYRRLDHTAASAPNAIKATTARPLAGLSATPMFILRWQATNTGPVTLQINDRPARPVLNPLGAPLTAGYAAPGADVLVLDDGDHYRIVTGADSTLTSAAVTAAQKSAEAASEAARAKSEADRAAAIAGIDAADFATRAEGALARASALGAPMREVTGASALVGATTVTNGTKAVSPDDASAMRVEATSANLSLEIDVDPVVDGAVARWLLIEYDLVSDPDADTTYYAGESGGSAPGTRELPAGSALLDMHALSPSTSTWQTTEAIDAIVIDFSGDPDLVIDIRSVRLYANERTAAPKALTEETARDTAFAGRVLRLLPLPFLCPEWMAGANDSDRMENALLEGKTVDLVGEYALDREIEVGDDRGSPHVHIRGQGKAHIRLKDPSAKISVAQPMMENEQRAMLIASHFAIVADVQTNDAALDWSTPGRSGATDLTQWLTNVHVRPGNPNASALIGFRGNNARNGQILGCTHFGRLAGGFPAGSASFEFVGDADPVDLKMVGCMSYFVDKAVCVLGAYEGVQIDMLTAVGTNYGVYSDLDESDGSGGTDSGKPLLVVSNSHFNCRYGGIRALDTRDFRFTDCDFLRDGADGVYTNNAANPASHIFVDVGMRDPVSALGRIGGCKFDDASRGARQSAVGIRLAGHREGGALDVRIEPNRYVRLAAPVYVGEYARRVKIMDGSFLLDCGPEIAKHPTASGVERVGVTRPA